VERTLAFHLRSVGGGNVFGAVATEVWVAENRKADVQVNIPGSSRKNIDVGIPAMPLVSGAIDWPTDEQIQHHVDEAQHTNDDDDDNNTHTNKLAHPEVTFCHAKISLFKKVSIEQCINTMTARKRQHYGNIPLTPFIVSAGGYLGKEAKDFLNECYAAIKSSAYTYELPEFRSGINFRIAARLLTVGSDLAKTHASSALRSQAANN